MESSREESLTGEESPGHSGDHETEHLGEADMEITPLAASGDAIVTPEEDEILTGAQTNPKDQGPSSDTASVSGEMARLQVHSPPCEESGDAGTLQ